MRTTIITDASFCPDHKLGGWGYWIASDRRPEACPEGKRGGGGELRKVGDNNAAEMMAVVNALHVALELGLVQAADDVLVQTDCQAAILAFTTGRSGMSDEQQAVVARWRAMIGGWAGLRVQFKHVKGHTNRATHGGARFGANRACDARARSYMRAARDRASNCETPNERAVRLA